MKTILITGAEGFIGRNLAVRAGEREGLRVLRHHRGVSEATLRAWVAEADVVFHLAGVNRPDDPREFEAGNVGFTRLLCDAALRSGRPPRIIASSSIQAEGESPYGVSKRRAEEVLRAYAAESGGQAAVFRLKNVFGKWCRPNYNSVVATFCHNVAHDLEIRIDDPSKAIELVHVDDVVSEFLKEMDSTEVRADVLVTPAPIPSHRITLGDLASRVRLFRQMPSSLRIPDFSSRFNQQLYATYLSYLGPDRWEYGLEVRRDARGSLAEFVKSPSFGQIFVSRTLPGITRGNHYHHVKVEKFLVLEGEGLIRFRHIEGSDVLEFRVRGEDYRVLDIPPGYTHSITNVGQGEMVTLFWASEIFDPDRPDTSFLPVDLPESGDAS